MPEFPSRSIPKILLTCSDRVQETQCKSVRSNYFFFSFLGLTRIRGINRDRNTGDPRCNLDESKSEKNGIFSDSQRRIATDCTTRAIDRMNSKTNKSFSINRLFDIVVSIRFCRIESTCNVKNVVESNPTQMLRYYR